MRLRAALLSVGLLCSFCALHAQTPEQSAAFQKNVKDCDKWGGANVAYACKAVLASAEANDDDKLDALVNLGDLYWSVEALDAALANFNAASSLSPEDCFPYIKRGTIYLQKQQYTTAVREFSSADKLAPLGLCDLSQSPHFWRGIAYFGQGNLSAAKADFAASIKLKHPPNMWFAVMLCLTRLRTGEDGRPDLVRFASLMKQSVQACAAKPRCFVRWTPFDEALTETLLETGNKEALLSAAKDDDPEVDSELHSIAYFVLGEMALSHNAVSQAKDYFESASSIYWRGDGNLLSRAELARLPADGVAPATGAPSQLRGLPGSVKTPPPLKAGGFYALVIGIQNYAPYPGQLTTPDADADGIASVLSTRYHFRVKELKDDNAKRSSILIAINQYKAELKPEDSLLIYYAGHGAYENDKAYWLPFDVDTPDSPNKIISDELTSSIRQLHAGHVLVISDSCYSGAMARNGATTLPPPPPADEITYLAKVRSQVSRTLMSGGGVEPVADGGGDGHSIFAQVLLDALNHGDGQQFTAAKLFYDQVAQKVGGHASQLPAYQFILDSGHDGGDFIFVRDTAP